jgi:hypothetical protein
MQAQRDHLNRNAGDVEVGVSFRLLGDPTFLVRLADPGPRARYFTGR